MEATQKLEEIKKLLSDPLEGKVVVNIKRKIKQLTDDFNDEVTSGDYDYFVDYCGLERNDLMLYSDFDRYQVYRDYLESQYGDPELDEVENFIEELDSYERNRRHVRYEISKLRDLLDVE